MTPRSVILGLLLTLLIAGSSYFVTEYAGGMALTGHHFPPIVFFAALALVLAFNPLLHLVGFRPLSMRELMVFTAIGLVGATWSHGTISRITPLVAAPSVQRPIKPNWTAVHTFSYIPGASHQLASGYLPQIDAFAAELRDAIGNDATPLHAYAGRIGPIATQLLLGETGRRISLNSSQRSELVRGLNLALNAAALPDDPALADVDWPEPIQQRLSRRAAAPLEPPRVTALNRAMLVFIAPDHVRPAPRGDGVLLLDGESDPAVTEPLLIGPSRGETIGLSEIPWDAWWPVLRLWGGLILLVGVASLALVVVVHRQWSQHELLPYPIARFFEEAVAREQWRLLPNVARSKLFWLAMIVFLVWSTSMGLHAWFDQFPRIPRKLDFTALAQLMPDASRIYGFRHFFNPVLFPVIVGFVFFIDERVSLSIGLSVLIWIVLGAVLMDFGLSMNTNRYDVGKSGPAIRFGAAVGMMLVILYLGRHYYFSLLKRAVGLPGTRDVPREGVVAVWVALCCSAAATWLLVHYGGMSIVMAMLLIGLSLMLVIVMARVNVETGLFIAAPEWIPWVMVGGFLGGSGIGTESLIVMAIGGLALVGSPRDALAAYAVNALRIGTDRRNGPGVGRLAPMLGGVAIIAFVVGLTVMLLLQYNRGLPPGEMMRNVNPAVSLGSFSGVLYELNAQNTTVEATGVSGWRHVTQAQPNAVSVTWSLIGFAAVLLCLWGRLRLPWWPLHPVAFIVIGTYPANATAFSFLVGVAIRKTVIWLGGKRAFDRAKPFMVGMIAAEVIAVIGWSVAGLAYYAATGATPTSIQLMP